MRWALSFLLFFSYVKTCFSSGRIKNDLSVLVVLLWIRERCCCCNWIESVCVRTKIKMCEHRTEIEKRFNRIGLIDNYTYIYIYRMLLQKVLCFLKLHIKFTKEITYDRRRMSQINIPKDYFLDWLF
jgi:hypothetical protein